MRKVDKWQDEMKPALPENDEEKAIEFFRNCYPSDLVLDHGVHCTCCGAREEDAQLISNPDMPRVLCMECYTWAAMQVKGSPDFAPEGYEEVPHGVDDQPLCPECETKMKWNGSSTILAKCIQCREEYKVDKQVRTAVQLVEKHYHDNETTESNKTLNSSKGDTE